jgi:hypothetical protein
MWVPKSTIANTDSIYISGDTIFLRDGSGFVKFKSGYGVDIVTAGDSLTISADTAEMATQYDISGFFTLPTFTAGSVIFSNGTTLAQDNSNLFWDDTNNRLGIGTTIPQAAIETRAGIGIGAYVVGDGLTVDGNVVSGGYPFRIQNFNPSVDGASYADFTGTPTAPNYVNGLSFTVSGYSGNFQSLFKNSVGLSSLSIESGIADTYLNFNQNVGSNSWSMGLDYSDSGKFKILKYYMPSTSGNGIIIDDNKVGINQHNPTYTLDVTGDVRITSRSGTPQYAAAFDSNGKLVTTGASPGSGTVTSIATTSPITGGTITSSGTIGIDNAAADGTTKGASTYTAADFNSSSGLISLDYTNGQAASGSTKGFLSSTDWTTFNNKGNGTVTSVGLTAGSGINISGTNPITTSGTMTISGTRLYPWDSGLWVSGDLYLRTNNTGTYPTITYSGGTIYYNLPSASSGQVLKYNGTGWAAGTDNTGTGVTSVTASSPLFSSGGATPNITIQSASGSQNGSLTSSDWTAFNNKMDAFYVAASGTAGVGVVGPLDQLTITAGTGITATRSLRNITVSSTVTNTDNQTLSWSSPNLSISGGNSVALPVLPSGSVNQTLRHDGSNWVASSLLKTGSSNFVDINSWPGTVISGSKLLVNGYLQYTASGYSATSLSGQDTYGGLTGVTVGSGLSLSSGSLSATDQSITNEGYLGIATAGGTKIRGFNSSGTGTGNGVGVTASNGIVVASGGDNSNGGDLTWQLTGQASALHTLSSNGLIARTGSGTVSARTITAGTGISVSNGDGVSGNPTISQNNTYASFIAGSKTLTTSNALINFTVAGANQNITANTGTDLITPTSYGGDYDINWSAYFSASASSRNACCILTIAGSPFGPTSCDYVSTDANGHVSGSITTSLGTSSVGVSCYYDNSTGSGTSISVVDASLSIKKLN